MLALPSPVTDSHGGQGAAAPAADLSRSEARLIGRAVRSRWPIDPGQRERVIETLMVIIGNPHHFDPRTVVAAGKAVMDADRINLEDEKRAVPDPPVLEGPDGRRRLDFAAMSDAELDRYLEANGSLR